MRTMTSYDLPVAFSLGLSIAEHNCPEHPDIETVPDGIPSDPFRVFCPACEDEANARELACSFAEYLEDDRR
jgi:hypothetical protein